MRRRGYAITFFYLCFIYFLCLPLLYEDKTDSIILTIQPYFNRLKEWAYFLYNRTSQLVTVIEPPYDVQFPITLPARPPLIIEEPPFEVLFSSDLKPPPIPLFEESMPIVEIPPIVIQELTPPSELPSIIVQELVPSLQLPTVAIDPSAPLQWAVQPLAFSLFAKQEPPPVAPIHKRYYPIPKRLIVSHDGSYGDEGGIGYGSDYTTFGIFLAPDYTAGSFYPLIDFRGHRFDNDTYAFSVGTGCRYIPSPNSFCEILGVNAYYDWRQGFLNQYNQFSVGVEVLGKRWDFRANGYFPVGAKSFRYTCVFDDYIGDYVIINEKQEVTSYGFNAEVGWLAIASKYILLYFAAGPYYLTTSSNCFGFQPIRGGRIRARPQYKDYFAFDVSVSHDSTYNTVWQTTFIVSIPLYQITHQNERPCRLTDRQIYQPIERFEVMSLGNRSCWWQNF